MTFLEAAWIVGQIPDDPARTSAPGELWSDEEYDNSTEELEVDSINDQLWLEEIGQ